MHSNDKTYMGREVKFADRNKALDSIKEKYALCEVKSMRSFKGRPPKADMLVVDIGNREALLDGLKTFLMKRGFFYYGAINYGGWLTVWRKSESVPEALYNPPIKITQAAVGEKLVNVVRDDMLISGTKQRALVPLLQLPEFDAPRVGYAGPVFGYAQIALSYACHLLGRKAFIFVERRPALHPLTAYAKRLGATIVEIGRGKNTALKMVQREAEKYSAAEDVKLLPFGLHHPMYSLLLEKSLRRVIDFNPQRMWVVAGSAVILGVLAKIWPETHFNVVQVGKKIWPDQLPERATLYVAPEKFWEKSKYPPPYPSVSSYDAKLWQFVLKDCQDGDYVWNVGKDL